MNEFSLSDSYIKASDKFVFFPFYDDNLPVTADSLGGEFVPQCGITLRSAGSMRFRWNETNPVRDNLLSSMQLQFVPVQLDHTHIVYDVHEAGDTAGKIGDGIITKNRALVPTVTVADCVPIFLWDRAGGVFGIVHSGWKGTGIAADAIRLAGERYGSRPEDFLVVIGPHIHECCYIVNEERAAYFAREFCEECVAPLEEGANVNVSWNNGGGKLYRLSLARANVAALKKIGVLDKHITLYTDCTCCTPGGIYGSNRRETAAAGRPDQFTVMAAFIEGYSRAF